MKLVIVGGVAAESSAAARARRLDEHAEIIVLGCGQHVSFANCGLPYHIDGVIKDREQLLFSRRRKVCGQSSISMCALETKSRELTVKQKRSKSPIGERAV